MKILKALVILLVLTRCEAYSQKIISNNKDTLIGYTLTQNDFIIKGLRQLKYYKIADSICAKQYSNSLLIIKNKNAIIKNDSLDKADFKAILVNKDKEFGLKQDECDFLNKSITRLNRDVKLQKLYKWTFIVIGVAANGYLGYKYITK
jgi:hypothetical protein